MLLKKVQDKRDIKFLESEKDPKVILQRLFEQNNLFSALEVMGHLNRFNEQSLQKALIKVVEESMMDPYRFC